VFGHLAPKLLIERQARDPGGFSEEFFEATIASAVASEVMQSVVENDAIRK
jgi:hypothetical protein